MAIKSYDHIIYTWFTVNRSVLVREYSWNNGHRKLGCNLYFPMYNLLCYMYFNRFRLILGTKHSTYWVISSIINDSIAAIFELCRSSWDGTKNLYLSKMKVFKNIESTLSYLSMIYLYIYVNYIYYYWSI